ncbi:MAG: cellulase family glycosylhydrolase [Planctomycetota bacterium]
MSPSRFAFVQSIVLAGVACAQQASPWSMRVERNGSFTACYRGTPIVESNYCFWGPKWGWVEVQTSVAASADGQTPAQGAVPALDLAWAGAFKTQGSRLQLRFEIDAGRDLRGIIGGGLEFSLRRDSAAFGGATPEPELSSGQRGFTWSPRSGETVQVAFDPPLAEIYFEGEGKARVRCMFVGKAWRKGKRPLSITLTLPAGASLEPSLADRYGPGPDKTWFTDAMTHDSAPVDLSFLNKDDRPAGKHGGVRVEGDRLVYEDGTPARFWGGNLAAYALFVPPGDIPAAAKRIARLGYNLMRIHHHDSMNWVDPTVIDKSRSDSRKFDKDGLDRVDRWVKALKDEGVYVWLDVHVGRVFKRDDEVPGLAEVERANGESKGFCYVNDRLRELMAEFQDAYLGHVNPYTKVAYKAEPAVMGVLVTNENDVTHHFGHMMLPDKNNPHHAKLFREAAIDFAKTTGLSRDGVTRTWEPGPAKIFLNELEARFARFMVDRVHALGMRVPVASTNYWGDSWMCALPALTAGTVIDVHSYGEAEALSVDPRYAPNFLDQIGAAHVYGKPLTITEWNVAYPAIDRFTAPAYLAAIACLQGWDAPMIYNYSQIGFGHPDHADTWSTFYDPALQGAMPAAAVMYRRQHMQPAKKRYCLQLDEEQLYGRPLTPASTASLRTLLERSQVTIGLPDVKALAWDGVPEVADDVEIVRQLDKDFIGADATEVVADTGELRRDFRRGRQVIDTTRTQAVNGWVGGDTIATADASFEIVTPKAFVALTSLDDQPLSTSKRILVTAIGRAEAAENRTPFRSEPVLGKVTLATKYSSMALVPLLGTGARGRSKSLSGRQGKVTLTLAANLGTHWFSLEAR